MKIFAKEREMGLEEVIAKQTSLAFETKASLVDDKLIGKAISNFLSSTASNLNQIDLHYLKSVLVTAGWNLNDDVFSVEHLWIARHTPEDKPFNLEHNEKDIIGHITSNCVVDAEGNPIDDSAELNSLPPVIQIVTNAVLYAHWDDIELKQRMAKIIAEIVNGEYFVSMECLFDDFDYGLISKADGSHRVLSRNEQSSFLSKHLRAYGGTGEFSNYKLGRVLKNICFSGKGLVKRPANPKSTIDSFVPFGGAVASLEEVLTEKINMSADIDVKSLIAERDALKAKVDELGEKQVKAKLDELTNEIQSQKAQYETVAKELADTVKAKKDKEEEMEKMKEMHKKEMASFETQLSEVNKNYETLKAEQVKANRVNLLKGAGMTDEEALASFTKFASVSDEVFADVVALAKSNYDFMMKKKKEEEEAKKSKGENVLENATQTDETNLAKAGETALPENTAHAALAKWLEAEVINKA